ncbi:MAG TPA: NAD-dependent epimerase/dehydratase family protein [Caulobacteraceae bacterium]
MKILITGGCGFIGTNLVSRLADNPDIEIRVFDNETLGKRAHLNGFDGEFIHGDMRDAAAVAAAVAGVDAVVHLAADTRVMDSIADPQYNFQVNVLGGFNLLEAMRAEGVERLVNASTGGAIIGEATPPVHEDMVARPMSPYGAAKLMMEGYCSAYAGSYGWKALSLRFSNVYGPKSFHKGSVVAAFFKEILKGNPLIVYGDGEQTRDFVFVGDLCQGIAAGLKGDATGAIQLGSGRPLTINALIVAMKRVVAPVKIEVEYRPHRAGEVRDTWCQIDRARTDLGFDPSTPLEDGLAETWAWFLAQRANGG